MNLLETVVVSALIFGIAYGIYSARDSGSAERPPISAEAFGASLSDLFPDDALAVCAMRYTLDMFRRACRRGYGTAFDPAHDQP